MDKLASWKAEQEEAAKTRRESPEAGRLMYEALQLLDDASYKLWDAGELELAGRAHDVVAVLLGVYKPEDVWPKTA